MAGDRKRLLIEVAAFLMVVALIIVFTTRHRRREDGVPVEERILMGTLVSVSVRDPGSCDAREAIDAAFAEIARVESLTTRYARDSEVIRLNEAWLDGASPESSHLVSVSVDREVARLVAHSLLLSSVTGGAFDITVEPLVELWSFGTDDFSVPSETEVAEAVALVGYERVLVDTAAATVAMPPGAGVDLDGVAKGYAVDRAMAVLRDLGVAAAVIDAGGDVRLLGQPLELDNWRVGVMDPRSDGLMGVLSVPGGAVATSGDYQRFETVDGMRYHHILDPSSGYPARGVVSVTVLAGTCEEADALATGVFVLGADAGMELVENLKGVEALIVEGDGPVEAVRVSSGLTDRFERLR